jgi:sulfide:quinone oxidoreductase
VTGGPSGAGRLGPDYAGRKPYFPRMAPGGGAHSLENVERADLQNRNGSRPQVLVVGGGVAGLEAVLALREMAGDRLAIQLHAPRREFVYRPLAVGEPFGAGRVVSFDLEQLAGLAGVSFQLGSVLAVDADRCRVLMRDGEEVRYDYLVVAPGVRRLWAVPGATTFWGTADEGGVGEVVRELRRGELRRVVFTMPTSSWPFPTYELALLTALELHRAGVEGTELTIVTPEDAPLRLFGSRASERVAGILAERGIEVVAGTHPVRFDAGLLHVAPGLPIEADAVVSSPRLEGRRIAGVPRDEHGFIPVDGHGRVLGAQRVFAAGDATTFPVKQGGIAAQQADVIAATIVAELEGQREPRAFDPVLRGTLWTGERPQFLYSRLTGGHGETSIVSEEALWEHEGKIVGEHLAPFLDSVPGAERPGAQTGTGAPAA